MNEIVEQSSGFSLSPSSLEEAMKFSEIIAKSDLVPKDYKNKPGNVLVSIQMGAEIGLPPMQALQNIAVINGRPSVWGDAIPAIIKSHPHYEWMKEEFDQQTMTATCTIKRRGDHEVTARFSQADAQAAGLWGKQGPWTQYQKRMLQMRARSFAARDAFPDALKGLSVAEEVKDIEAVEATIVKSPESVEKPGLPQYTDEQFADNINAWAAAIEAGKATPQKIVSMVSSKYVMTEDQEAAIYDLAPVETEQ